ncbi:hypothetical protein EDB19DRAFT_1691613 [Suillus lakei]|nr:hypothetical protein EDB19DRAFT_1691613 [Suillus lakei]
MCIRSSICMMHDPVGQDRKRDITKRRVPELAWLIASSSNNIIGIWIRVLFAMRIDFTIVRLDRLAVYVKEMLRLVGLRSCAQWVYSEPLVFTAIVILEFMMVMVSYQDQYQTALELCTW